MTEVLLEEREEGVVILTMNRPESLNALNPALMRALRETLRRLAEDETVGCIVLTGAGRGFCPGADVKVSQKAAEDRQTAPGGPGTGFEHRLDWVRRSVEAARLLHDMGKPTIAMINGPCAGAGMSLAGACDLRFAASSAVMTTAFTRGGLSGDYGGSWFWTKILGSAKARELYLLSEKIDAARALTDGMVARVFDDTDLRARTLEIAHRLANGPRAALRYAKENINAAEMEDLKSVCDREATNMLLSRQALMAARQAQRSS